MIRSLTDKQVFVSSSFWSSEFIWLALACCPLVWPPARSNFRGLGEVFVFLGSNLLVAGVSGVAQQLDVVQELGRRQNVGSTWEKKQYIMNQIFEDPNFSPSYPWWLPSSSCRWWLRRLTWVRSRWRRPSWRQWAEAHSSGSSSPSCLCATGRSERWK